MSLASFFGESELCVSRKHAAATVDLLALMNIRSYGHSFSDEGFRFKVFRPDEHKAIEILRFRDIPCENLCRKGIIPWLEKYKKRYGIICGLLAFAVITYLLSGIVWRIDVVGNSSLSRDDVIFALSTAGLSLGTRLDIIDTDAIESRTLVNDKRISWISVNMNGTCAYVEVRERVDRAEAHRVLPYANVVSTEDAIITEIEVLSGMAAVKPGSYVRKGEMLINGIIHKEAIGTYPTYASGRIIGKITEDYEIEFPLRAYYNEPTGKKKISLRINIFGKEIILLPFSGEFPQYSQSSKTYSYGYGGKVLPLSLTVDVASEQVTKSVGRSPSETQREALRYLSEKFGRDHPDAEIIEKHVTVTETDASVIVLANIVFECEIGRISEFDIED